MSTVAGQRFENKIVLAADTRVSSSLGTRIDLGQSFSKLGEGVDFIYGSAGYSSEVSLFNLYARDHSIGTGGVVRVIEYLVEFSRWKADMTGDPDIKNSYILAHSSGLFSTEFFAVDEIEYYCSIGSGKEHSLAALYLGKDVSEAVQVACALDCYSDLPVLIKELKLK